MKEIGNMHREIMHQRERYEDCTIIECKMKRNAGFYTMTLCKKAKENRKYTILLGKIEI